MKSNKTLQIKQLLKIATDSVLAVVFIALCIAGVVGYAISYNQISNTAFAFCGYSILIAVIGASGIAWQSGFINFSESE